MGNGEGFVDAGLHHVHHLENCVLGEDAAGVWGFGS
jgi:hypothetical protein